MSLSPPAVAFTKREVNLPKPNNYLVVLSSFESYQKVTDAVFLSSKTGQPVTLS